MPVHNASFRSAAARRMAVGAAAVAATGLAVVLASAVPGDVAVQAPWRAVRVRAQPPGRIHREDDSAPDAPDRLCREDIAELVGVDLARGHSVVERAVSAAEHPGQ